MNQIKKLAGQTLVYGLSTMLGRFLNYLLVVLHTRALGPQLYGNLSYFYANTAILLVVLTFGMETGFFRFASKKEENYNSVLSTSFLTVLVTTSIFILVSIVLKDKWLGFFQVDSSRYLLYFILILSFDVVSAIPFAKLRIDERPMKFMWIKLLGIGLNIFFNLFYLLLCRLQYESGSNSIFAKIYNPEYALDYVLIANVIGSGITLLVLLPEIFKVKFNIDLNLIKRLFKYSFPIVLIGLAGQLNDQIDKLLIPKLINDQDPMAQLGIYAGNFRLAVIMVLFIQMFRYAAEPFFFKNSQNKDAKKLYSNVMNFFVIFGLIIFLGVNFYIELLKHFIDKEFWEALPVVPILLMSKLLFGILFSLSIWYKVTDKTKYGVLIAGTGAVISIILNVILIPRIGYMGSAIASLVSSAAMLIVSYSLSIKHYLIKYNFKKILFYFGFAMSLYVISELLKSDNTVITIAINTIMILTFIAIAYLKEKKNIQYED